MSLGEVDDERSGSRRELCELGVAVVHESHTWAYAGRTRGQIEDKAKRYVWLWVRGVWERKNGPSSFGDGLVACFLALPLVANDIRALLLIVL